MSKKSCNFAPKLAKIEDMNKYETINTENDELMIREEFEALLEDYRQTPHRQKIELITDFILCHSNVFIFLCYN